MAEKTRYLDPSCKQTLREGIKELILEEGANDASKTVDHDLVRAIHVHDAIHVLFACPTNLQGEIAAHV